MQRKKSIYLKVVVSTYCLSLKSMVIGICLNLFIMKCSGGSFYFYNKSRIKVLQVIDLTSKINKEIKESGGNASDWELL